MVANPGVATQATAKILSRSRARTKLLLRCRAAGSWDLRHKDATASSVGRFKVLKARRCSRSSQNHAA